MEFFVGAPSRGLKGSLRAGLVLFVCVPTAAGLLCARSKRRWSKSTVAMVPGLRFAVGFLPALNASLGYCLFFSWVG